MCKAPKMPPPAAPPPPPPPMANPSATVASAGASALESTMASKRGKSMLKIPTMSATGLAY